MRRWKAVLCMIMLLFSISACGKADIDMTEEVAAGQEETVEQLLMLENMETEIQSGNETETQREDAENMQVYIDSEDGRIVFQLNDSIAAKEFYEQLPLSIWIEDYNNSEKIFYPPEKLDVSDAPLAEGPMGTLAYFEPWDNIAMFYGDCGRYTGLYGLGEAISGAEYIENLVGEVQLLDMGDMTETNAPETVLNSEQTEQTGTDQTETEQAVSEETGGEEEMPRLEITVGGRIFTAVLYDNETAGALLERLPLTLAMSELNGNEKYYYFSDGFPTDFAVPEGIHAGDLMLYGSDCLVLFYESFSTGYSYTPLGYIENPEGLSDVLGSGNVEVSFAAG